MTELFRAADKLPPAVGGLHGYSALVWCWTPDEPDVWIMARYDHFGDRWCPGVGRSLLDVVWWSWEEPATLPAVE